MSESEHQTKKLRCCGRLLAEWRLSMFSATDANGKTIDLEACFQPTRMLARATKAVCLVWAFQVVVLSIIQMQEERSFWLAYLTHWGAIFTVLYLTLSVACLVCPISQDPVNLLTKCTWLSFTTAVCLEILITLLYWTLDFEKGAPIRYTSVMQHGVFMLLVMVDGYIVNRIPVRFRQLIGFVVVEATYIIWSGIHAATSIGDPTRSDLDPTTDDDAIYGALNWNERPGSTSIAAFGMLLIVTPILFLFVWYVSTFGRRYRSDYSEGDEQQCENEDDVERGASDKSSSGDTSIHQHDDNETSSK